jgi:hypothetical protein
MQGRQAPVSKIDLLPAARVMTIEPKAAVIVVKQFAIRIGVRRGVPMPTGAAKKSLFQIDDSTAARFE